MSAGLVFLPLAVPLLPPDVTASYAVATGVVPQIERGEGKASQLPRGSPTASAGRSSSRMSRPRRGN